MAKEQQANKAPAQTNLDEQAILDRRLSQLEVSIFIAGLFCLFVFGAVFLNNQILQNHNEQMTSRAQSVADWITAAHDVRKRNAGLSPKRCQRNQGSLSTCFQNMVAPGQPFAALRNIYAAQQATAPAFAFVAAPRLDSGPVSCRDLPSPVFISAPGQGVEVRPDKWTGMIIVQLATVMDDLSSVANRLSVGYCNRQQSLMWVVPSVSF